MQNTSANTQDNQKLVIGPWTHGTIAEDIVGDITFPQSVFDLKIVNSTNNISIVKDDVEYKKYIRIFFIHQFYKFK